jgi:hypothetical protein
MYSHRYTSILKIKRLKYAILRVPNLARCREGAAIASFPLFRRRT